MSYELYDPAGILDERHIREINVQSERFVSEQKIPERLFIGVERIGGIAGKVSEQLLFSVAMHVMTHKFAPDKYDAVFKSPSSPWEFFKQKYFPRFLKRMFPVRYNTETKVITISRKAIFPFLQMEGDCGRIYIQENVSVSGENNERQLREFD